MNAMVFRIATLVLSSSLWALPALSKPHYAKASPTAVNAVLGDTSYLWRYGRLPGAHVSERHRIQVHLSYVETWLRGRPTAHLSASQKKARQKMLGWLGQYWRRGAFPQNHPSAQGAPRKPNFIDHRGRICAVGYLLQRSAGRAFAERINRKYQFHYLWQMKHPKLERWQKASGFSVRELSMIQPSYGWRRRYRVLRRFSKVWGGKDRAGRRHGQWTLTTHVKMGMGCACIWRSRRHRRGGCRRWGRCRYAYWTVTQQRGPYSHGRKHGTWRHWSTSSTRHATLSSARRGLRLLYAQSYAFGKLHGSSRYYYPNTGSISRTEQYDRGRRHGVWGYYSSNGRVFQRLYYRYGQLQARERIRRGRARCVWNRYGGAHPGRCRLAHTYASPLPPSYRTPPPSRQSPWAQPPPGYSGR